MIMMTVSTTMTISRSPSRVLMEEMETTQCHHTLHPILMALSLPHHQSRSPSLPPNPKSILMINLNLRAFHRVHPNPNPNRYHIRVLMIWHRRCSVNKVPWRRRSRFGEHFVERGIQRE